MSTEATEAVWAVGDEVGWYETGSRIDRTKAGRSIVFKVGKRDVVLEDGQRFNLARGWVSNGTWGATRYFLPVTDPKFVLYYARARQGDAVDAVARATSDFQRNPSEAAADRIAAAVEAWRDATRDAH